MAFVASRTMYTPTINSICQSQPSNSTVVRPSCVLIGTKAGHQRLSLRNLQSVRHGASRRGQRVNALSVVAIGGGAGAPAPREPELPPSAPPAEPKPTSSPGLDNPDGGIGRDLPLPTPPSTAPGETGLPVPGADVPIPGLQPPTPQPIPGISPPGGAFPAMMAQPLFGAAVPLPAFGVSGWGAATGAAGRMRMAVRSYSAVEIPPASQTGNAGRGPEMRDATESDNAPGNLAGFTDTEVDSGNMLSTFQQAQGGSTSQMAGMGRPANSSKGDDQGVVHSTAVSADSPGSAPEMPTPPDLAARDQGDAHSQGGPAVPSGTGTGVVADRKHNYDTPMTHPEQEMPVVNDSDWERPAGQVEVPMQQGDRIPGQ